MLTFPATASLVPPPFAPGSVWLVGAGPGDPGLLTLHALAALESADIVLHDALVAPEILALAGPNARLEAAGKRAGKPGRAQLAINERLIALARQGLRVVRLKGGDPLVFGRGGEEALALAAAGIPFRIVPGISAGVGATAAAAIPLTHRGLAHAAIFVTGHDRTGGLPADLDWAALSRAAPVIVLYMALATIGPIASALIAAGRDPAEPVAFLSNATTPRQRVRRTTLANAGAVAARIPRQEPTLIILGPTVGLSDLLGPLHEAAPMRLIPPPQARAASA
ncbi:MAG TPA: uroporphyrinogen-III C-methyltransferase [Acetobacteraceae bacterium]|nr:uroporphyrinogen-III C-methyltransferase [Acetobacteraceae bacterium]